MEFQFHVCNIGSGEKAVWIRPLEELQHLGGRSTNCEKTVDSLLNTSGTSPTPVASQGESIERAVIMMRLPVTDLPFALRVHRIGRHHGNAHGTIDASTFTIEPLSRLVRELTGVGSLAMSAAVHVALVQYALCVLLTRTTHEFVPML